MVESNEMVGLTRVPRLIVMANDVRPKHEKQQGGEMDVHVQALVVV